MVKMSQRRSSGFKRVLLVFRLLLLGVSWTLCDSQVNTDEADAPSGADDGPFFALRSCHQQLHGEAGEFFSPDYLCSNPPLWCNWTIQVNPGKRVHLHLEDLTADHTCHFKRDQVHVEDPAGEGGGHKVLQRCWREAKFTSTSNALEVVLLIGSRPGNPYRGFYGRYQAFGPLVVYNPQEVLPNRRQESDPPPGLEGFTEFGSEDEGKHLESDLTTASDLMFDDYVQPSALMAEDTTDTEMEANHQSDPSSLVYPPAAPAPTQGTSRSGRGAAPTPSDPSDPAVYPAPPQEQHDGQSNDLAPASRGQTAIRRTAEQDSGQPEDTEEEEEEEEEEKKKEEVIDSQNQTMEEESGGGRNRSDVPPPSEGAEPGPEQPLPQPNVVEPLLDQRAVTVKNHSDRPHLPGDHLFEVAVEVNFSQYADESWDQLARSLLLSVKSLISEQLKSLSTTLSTSSKRIKRLSAGALYILWLHTGQASGGPQVHRSVHSALQGLIAAHIDMRGGHSRAVVTSVSTTDVNECGTQLVLCHVNADCLNWFGSYSCHCRPGFLDVSRVGSGGTACVEVAEAAGCSSGLSAETKGVYVLFFLLSSLILMLLVAAGVLYRRHRRGAFLVRCQSSSSISSPDPKKKRRSQDGSFCADSELPLPPPPSRGFREGWPQVKERCPPVDLPLLRFSPLLPPDGYKEPQEGGKGALMDR